MKKRETTQQPKERTNILLPGLSFLVFYTIFSNWDVLKSLKRSGFRDFCIPLRFSQNDLILT